MTQTAKTKLIVHTVTINRTRAPQEALDATGRTQYTSQTVVDSMPKGEGEEVEVIFFKPDPEEYTRPGFLSDDDLEKALDRRDYIAADPISLAGVNEADPAFADEHPNGTHWKNANGDWCSVVFSCWEGERRVSVYCRGGSPWSPFNWWFAGLRRPI